MNKSKNITEPLLFCFKYHSFPLLSTSFPILFSIFNSLWYLTSTPTLLRLVHFLLAPIGDRYLFFFSFLFFSCLFPLFPKRGSTVLHAKGLVFLDYKLNARIRFWFCADSANGFSLGSFFLFEVGRGQFNSPIFLMNCDEIGRFCKLE